MMDVAWLRGRRAGLEELETTVRQYPRGTWSLIVLDAFYRFLPRGCDENSNSDMAQVMNHIDAIAGYADAAIVNVHHATKGGQQGKDVMDIGAGAGAIGRATDSHIVFLRHAEEDCITMRARCRSFRPPTPCVVQLDFQFPRAWVRDDLDPDQLYTPEPTRKGKGATCRKRATPPLSPPPSSVAPSGEGGLGGAGPAPAAAPAAVPAGA